MLGHEIGHQHQQPAYMINKATESTVNIYSYVVERNIQGEGYNRTSAARWAGAQNTYLRLPFSQRIYDMDDDVLSGITGFNRDELRFMVWEQLFLIFGDQFYKTLHRVVREEKVSTGGGADERRAYLIWKASQISGYDLTEFFNIWGIRVTNSAIKADLRAKMAAAKANSKILDLSVIGRTPDELARVTGQNPPEWVPIALRGITTSEPEGASERAEWTVVTSYAGPTDTAVGGDQPEYIIDESTVTAFAFVKPGVTYGNITAPADAVPSFTIDMKTAKTINYVSYMHRTGNTTEWLRARQISIYGSNDGEDFTVLKEHHMIDHVKNDNEIIVEFPDASCRYIKVVIEDWNRDSGSTVQVADFKVGAKIVTEPLKFRVAVITDDGIVTSQTGTTLEDEDSDYTINFTLTEDKNVANATVDGRAVALTKTDEGYSLTVTVSNHLTVNLTSSYDPSSSIGTILKESKIHVYPNPIQAGQPFSIYQDGDLSNGELAVYNLYGAKVLECEFGNNSVSIEHPGVYVLEVRRNSHVSQAKIIVK